jgi:hypothetical protein
MRIFFCIAMFLMLELISISPSFATSTFDEAWNAYTNNNYLKAAAFFLVDATRGNAKAQYNLAVMYDKGQSVPQDFKEAAKWYRLAADQGYVPAQYNLGVMYEKGESVPRDYKEAAKWFRLAAEQGTESLQFKLGQMFTKGQGVPQDDSEAAKWFRVAAELGSEGAQIKLCLMFEKSPLLQKISLKRMRLGATPLRMAMKEHLKIWKKPAMN